jgi:hypothetical protein
MSPTDGLPACWLTMTRSPISIVCSIDALGTR